MPFGVRPAAQARAITRFQFQPELSALFQRAGMQLWDSMIPVVLPRWKCSAATTDAKRFGAE
jgi:hypothetical protein